MRQTGEQVRRESLRGELILSFACGLVRAIYTGDKIGQDYTQTHTHEHTHICACETGKI